MKTVKESFEINNMTVLVCDMFDDDIITDTLATDGGNFGKDDFVVEKPKLCFSKPTTRNIIIKKANLPKKISKIRFA